jgi:hypothetical protein
MLNRLESTKSRGVKGYSKEERRDRADAMRTHRDTAAC